MIRQANQNIKETLKEHINFFTVIKGILFSYLITILIFLVFAFILTYANFPQKFITPVVVSTTIVSILIAGAIVSRSLKTRGWLNGGVVGLIYILLLYTSSSIVLKDFSINRYMISMLLIGLLSGSIGGILGINIKTRSRRKIHYSKK